MCGMCLQYRALDLVFFSRFAPLDFGFPSDTLFVRYRFTNLCVCLRLGKRASDEKKRRCRLLVAGGTFSGLRRDCPSCSGDDDDDGKRIVKSGAGEMRRRGGHGRRQDAAHLRPSLQQESLSLPAAQHSRSHRLGHRPVPLLQRGLSFTHANDAIVKSVPSISMCAIKLKFSNHTSFFFFFARYTQSRDLHNI